MGAWIETQRGHIKVLEAKVAPFMGAWIETGDITYSQGLDRCRSLHGSVD